MNIGGVSFGGGHDYFSLEEEEDGSFIEEVANQSPDVSDAEEKAPGSEDLIDIEGWSESAVQVEDEWAKWSTIELPSVESVSSIQPPSEPSYIHDFFLVEDRKDEEWASEDSYDHEDTEKQVGVIGFGFNCLNMDN